MTSAQLYSVIEAASRQVESQIYKDNSFPDLRDLLGSQSHVSADYTFNPNKFLLHKGVVIPLPPNLTKLYSRMLFIFNLVLLNVLIMH
jgi:hypothetical protein